jgi:uncharacterized cupin superfamily protein
MMLPPKVVRVCEAPNWAAIRFRIDPALMELRVLRDVLGCESLGLSYLRLGPRAKLTVGHRHPAGEEVYVLVSGRAEIKIADDIVALEPMSAVRVPARQLRALRAVGDQDAVFLVAGSRDDPALTELVPNFWPIADDSEIEVRARVDA